jgi:predicted O-linked N-acetylglucosamine transferase (SPINDLY family)
MSSGTDAGRGEATADAAARALHDARWAESVGLAERAIAEYRKLAALCPDSFEAHDRLARLLLAIGRYDEAQAFAVRAVALCPADADANVRAGQACLKLGATAQAVPFLEKALAARPAMHAVRRQLAETLLRLGRKDDAFAAFSSVEEQFAADVQFLVAMVQVYHRSHAPTVTERVYLRLLELAPQRPETYSGLAQLYMDYAQYSKARDVVSRGLQLKPDDPTLWNTLALAQASLGLVRDALASYRRVLEIAPNQSISHSNLLLTMHYSTDVGPEELAAEHRRWGALHAPPSLATRGFRNTPEPGRRIRIGYVSADFRRHSVAFFFESLLDHRDRAAFEVVCYSDAGTGDEVTRRIRTKADRYVAIDGMHDRQVADLILGDSVDVLVDLAGHAGGSRITLFGYKPAPVQVSYCGYPDTTGITAMDYRITDALADPPGVEAHYTEQLCRLPGGFLCYRPLEQLPELRPSPSQSGMPVTFGSFNREFKVSQVTYDLWCRILRELPESPLLIKSFAGGDPVTRSLQLAEFERRGVAPERIRTVGFIADQANHLGGYRNVDIALDTFPYHGTTTTLDALSMSVPVITLAGYNHASRVGVSLLTRVGLAEFVARTPDEYVELAVGLARQPQRIAGLHATLRERLLASPLCDGPRFMRSFEYALRGMWCNWCRGQGVTLTPEQAAMAAFDFTVLPTRSP